MANRVIKDSIWTSKSLAKLKPYYQDQWPRWILMADDHGCFNADPEVISGLIYPKRPESAAKAAQIRQVFYDAGMLFVWEKNGREWGFFTSWDEHQFCNKLGVDDDGTYTKHRRKTPEPPSESLVLYLQEHGKDCDIIQQGSTKVVKPIPKPKPNPMYEEILKVWQTLKPKAHLTAGAKRSIEARLKNYTVEDICRSIANYRDSTAKWPREFREKGGWTLEQFLARGEGEAGLGRFIDGPINTKKKADGYIE